MPNPEASAKSALGLDGNLSALLCYLVGIVGLILAFIEKDNKFVRFHAWQSLLLGVAATVIAIVLVIVMLILMAVAGGIAGVNAGLAIGSLFTLIFVVFGLAVLAAAIWAAIKGYQGEIFKLPLIGNFAEKMANK